MRFNSFLGEYDQLLEMGSTVDIHTKNLRLLVTEVYKSLHKLSPPLMWDIFTRRESRYSLRKGCKLNPLLQTASSRAINSFDFRATLAWNNLDAEIKSQTTLSRFKTSIKSIHIYCECRKCAL